MKVSNEKTGHIVTEKKSSQAYSPPILENLASAVTKIWHNEPRNEQTLNEEIIKNKNINHYYKRNKRWFDLQNAVLKRWQTYLWKKGS